MRRKRLRTSYAWAWSFRDGGAAYLDGLFSTRRAAREAARRSWPKGCTPAVVLVEIREVSR
jgi:hypothetical protein